MLRAAVGTLLIAGAACFAQSPWTLQQAALDAGYRVEMRRDGNTPCAVMMPPAAPLTEGNLTQTLPAADWRGKTIRVSAWLRVDRQPAQGRLWFRINRPNQPLGLFDNLTDQPIGSPVWTRAELTFTVSADAETVDLGILSNGAGTVWIKDISFLILASAAAPGSAPTEPRNLKFLEGNSPPAGWIVLGENFHVQVSRRGCHVGPPCATLTAPSLRTSAYGAFLQTFAASAYRGRRVRFRAFVRLQPNGPEDHARLFLRTGPDHAAVNQENILEHLDYRELHARDWTPLEIVRQIDDNVEALSLGVMLVGKGRVSLDEVSFTLLPDLPAPAVSAYPALPEPSVPDAPPLTAADLGKLPDLVLPPASGWPSLPTPTFDEQSRAVNAASVFAVGYIHNLPNFLCTLLVHRSENRGTRGWGNRDTLNVQLGFADGLERYKLVSIDNKPSKVAYRDLGGAISEGDFGSIMAEIFQPRIAEFHWDHWGKLRGRIVQVYRYEITRRKSAYQLMVGEFKNRPLSTVTAHHGYVYIEKDSSQILRIEQIGDPPADFPLRSATETIDYDWNDVGGQRYLLPLRAEIALGTATESTLNVIEFRDYRKFTAESQITFEQAGR